MLLPETEISTDLDLAKKRAAMNLGKDKLAR